MTISVGVVPALGVTYSGAYPATLANLLPQIPNFNGSEQRDGETIQDWMEHFEPIATLAGWGDHFKLVHLTSALRDSAHSFFHSCTPAQKSSYQLLTAELKKRFTPVQLTAVQTQLFHSHQQGTKESIDNFAQELRKLHSKAYAVTTYVNPETEKVGQMVLANQFISGLRPELQAKVVGMEGSMDALVLKAWFKEAKAKELTGTRGLMNKRQSVTSSGTSTPAAALLTSPTSINISNSPPLMTTPSREDGRRPGARKCFNCGMEGHMAHACPYEKATRGQEAHGRTRVSNVTTEETHRLMGKEARDAKIEQLRQELHAAKLEAGLEDNGGRMSLLQLGDSVSELGPTIYADVAVNGVTTKALIDTGSPATIISFDLCSRYSQRTVLQDRPQLSGKRRPYRYSQSQRLPCRIMLDIVSTS